MAGIEASITVQPASRVAIKAGGDYVNAEDTKRHVPLPFTPPLRGLVRGTYQDHMYSGVVEWRVAAPQRRPRGGGTHARGLTGADGGVSASAPHAAPLRRN